jgi:low temperature requirement protein LtrA
MGKRVSWVELYLDLVFVLAVGRLAHLIVAHPEMHSGWRSRCRRTWTRPPPTT